MKPKCKPTHTPSPKRGASAAQIPLYEKEYVFWRGKEIFQRAKNLRNRETYAGDILWGYLKTSPLGYKFRRQQPYSNYILDFYCHQLKLVIEVDGSIHNDEAIIK